MRAVVVGLAVLAQGGALHAQAPGDPPTDAEGEVIVIVDTRSRGAIARDQRAVSIVDREALEDRAVRSVPDALAGAPGISVQKTNLAGGSPYVRGVTGQQTALVIDGFRLGTSIMRAGPNQYLATVDPGAIDRIEVLRGAGSVLYGSDAIGGVIEVTTRQPGREGHRAAGATRVASAERSVGGRLQLDGNDRGVAWLAGGGARRFGDLRGPGAPALATVPEYDGSRQQFTGYDEWSGDAKAVVPVGPGALTAAALLMRQTDAPRTDKCTAGPPLDCRFFDEQFYDLAYARWAADVGAVRELEVGAAVARTHERRSRVREDRDTIDRELDTVLTAAFTARASTPTRRLGDAGGARASYGAELYADKLYSEAATEDRATGAIEPRDRGKYLDGSSYLALAAFGFGELVVDDAASVTGGLRLSGVRARVARDPAAGAPGFADWLWHPVVGGGVRLHVGGPVWAVASANQGFRAPNLDDLTAQSSEGPGFQIGNPALRAESSITFEGGVQVRDRRATASAFAYATYIDDFITREVTTCPEPLQAACGDEAAVFRLINAESARVRGVELDAHVQLPAGVSLLGAATWTRGDRQTSAEPADPREPLSRLPPTHGVFAVRFAIARDYFAETAARWALAQDRLSAADLADARIPPGGTPGFGVVDVRAGARIRDDLRVTVAVENLANSRWRVHGSGVDGAGLNVVVAVSGGVGWR